MRRHQVVLVTILAATIAACGAAPAGPPDKSPDVTLPSAPNPGATPASPSPTAAAACAHRRTRSPKPTPPSTAKPVPLPPKPSGVTFDVIGREIKNGDDYELTYTVTWKKPQTKGVEIRVYGVSRCLSIPEDAPYNSDGPCLVKGTTLPRGVLKLIARQSRPTTS